MNTNQNILRYSHRFQVRATLEQVVEFHNDARALRRLTPPPMIVQFHEVEPLAEGSKADFTMWLGPLPVRWLAIHSNVSRAEGFTDSQQKGPFKTWVHRHGFHVLSDNETEVVDEIQAEFSQHWFWNIVGHLMWLNLPVLFAYRARVTRKTLENTP